MTNTADDIIFIFGAILLLGTIAWLYSHPLLPLAINIAGFYFYPTILGWFGLATNSTYTAMFWFLVSIPHTIGLIYSRRNQIGLLLSQPAVISFFIFIGYIITSWLVISKGHEVATKQMVLSIFTMISPFIAGLLLNSKLLEKLLKILATMGLVGIVIALIKYRNGELSEYDRFSITEATNALGFVYNIGFTTVILIAYSLRRGKFKFWLLTCLVIIATIFLIIAAGSRGPIIAFALALIVLTIGEKKWKIVIIASISLAGLGVAIYYLLPYISSYNVDRFLYTIDFVSNYSSRKNDELLVAYATGGRADIWSLSIALWLENFWVGVGLSGTEVAGIITFAHNFVIQILVELGMIGFIIFILFISFVCNRITYVLPSLKNDFAATTALPLAIYVLTTLCFSSRLQEESAFWFMCGMIIAIRMNNLPVRYIKYRLKPVDTKTMLPVR